MFRRIAIFGQTIGLCALASALLAAEPVESVDRWSGKLQDESLRKLAPPIGFIADAEMWSKLWRAWRPGEEVPKVNFEKELVLVGTVPGPNLVIMNPVLDEDGDLRFVVAGTKIGGPGFGYLLLRTGRDGVKSVNGNALMGKSTSDYIRVEILGRLNSGVVAIGGETTGTTVTANGITWELDFGKNAELPNVVSKLDGKRVIVKGSLERRAGVEIKERWIVTVTSLKSADDVCATAR